MGSKKAPRGELAGTFRAPVSRFGLVLLLAVVGCASRTYQRAQHEDTSDAYRAFIQENPKDENVEAARVRLAELEFEAAKKVHTPLAYKRFLEEFPDAKEARSAKALLEGLRFNAAMERGTEEALRQFIADHPDGAHVEEAKKRLAEKEVLAAEKSNDPRTLEQIARAYPKDPRGAEARTRLDEERFKLAQASGPDALYRYLEDFPAGSFREQAQIALLSYKLDALLFSGLIEQAKAEIAKSPLSSRLPDLDARVRSAEEARALWQSRDEKIAAAFAEHDLRDIADLERALAAPDQEDRWQAAEELSQHVSVRVIEPLLNALRSGRNGWLRHRAFKSLRQVIAALPPKIAQYELASRLHLLRSNAVTPETELVIAVLLDLSGDLESASAEYQKAYLPDAPDPVVLLRWIEIREQRKQWFSAAVAARALSKWAESSLAETELSGGESLPVATARQICAAAESAKIATEAITRARAQKTEFPEDLLQFELAAKDVSRLAEAKLKDAELKLHTQDRNAKSCRDDSVRERIQAAEQSRLAALRAIAQKPPPNGRAILELASGRDPSSKVRAEAQVLLAGLKT